MLYTELKKYSKSGAYPMHMPGHKRNTEMLGTELPYDIDISEINDFDNLQHPLGILHETEELASELYGSDRAYLLTDGSTAGILASIGALTSRGGKILMARNCHISVYNAVALFGLTPVYIMPGIDETTGIACSIAPAEVESALDSDPDIKLVVVTSPTYEGVVSDITSIAAVAHKRGALLFVDSAHGAHLGFSDSFPGSAVRSDADVTVMSLHKTLPAMTQCALLHVRRDSVDMDEMSRMLNTFRTTSPSYVLMSSIDRCLRYLSTDRDMLFSEYSQRLGRFSAEMEALQYLSVVCKGRDTLHDGFFAFDPGKIVVVSKNTAMSGIKLADILRTEYLIEVEMASAGYVVAMTSVCDSAEGFKRLSEAILAIDRFIAEYPDGALPDIRGIVPPEQETTPEEAACRQGIFSTLEESVGLMSLEYVWVYPPGIPLLVPGEIISEEIIKTIADMARSGLAPMSTRGLIPEVIYVDA